MQIWQFPILVKGESYFTEHKNSNFLLPSSDFTISYEKSSEHLYIK